MTQLIGALKQLLKTKVAVDHAGPSLQQVVLKHSKKSKRESLSVCQNNNLLIVIHQAVDAMVVILHQLLNMLPVKDFKLNLLIHTKVLKEPVFIQQEQNTTQEQALFQQET